MLTFHCLIKFTLAAQKSLRAKQPQMRVCGTPIWTAKGFPYIFAHP